MEEKIVVTEKSLKETDKIDKTQDQEAYQKWRQTVEKQKQEASSLKKQEESVPKKQENPFSKINPFSSTSFKDYPSFMQTKTAVQENDGENVELSATQNEAQTFNEDYQNDKVTDFSSTVFSPNYDMMESLSQEEHEKIFGTEQKEDLQEKQAKKKKISIKSIVFAVLFVIFGIWGIANISTIDSLNSQIQTATDNYNLNLANYLKNLATLDTTNQENMENLFEVIPTESLPPASVGEQSNWFDRFCNFLSGLFGG